MTSGGAIPSLKFSMYVLPEVGRLGESTAVGVGGDSILARLDGDGDRRVLLSGESNEREPALLKRDKRDDADGMIEYVQRERERD